MKKSFTTTALLLFALHTAFSQFQPGSLFLSGRLGVQFTEQEGASFTNSGTVLTLNSPDVSTRNILIAPSLGFLVLPNLAAGLELSYENQRSEFAPLPGSLNNQPRENESNLFAIGPFLRYFRSLGPKLGFQLDIKGRLGFGSSSSNSQVVNSVVVVEEEISTVGLSLEPGLYYLLSPRLLLDASLGGISYTSDKITRTTVPNESRRNNRFSTFLDSGLGLNLRLSYFLNGGAVGE